MNPFKLWLDLWEMWLDLLFEVRALRECHNQNRGRLELIEKALQKEGIEWKQHY